MKLLNAFSLSMFADWMNGGEVTIKVVEISDQDVNQELTESGIESCVGHADAAKLYSALLGRDIPMNRCNTQMKRGEVAIVGQYIGPRLPEGAVTLPEGATIKWLMVRAE